MKNVLIQLLNVYHRQVSPWLGGHCRFLPSCSVYAKQAVSEKGVLEGLRLAFVRLLKCHPFHPGGIDEPK